MAPSNTAWWTDDRVAETVTAAYVHSHLRTNEQELLKKAIYFGGDLTDDTYLDWILTRAKRLFLILVSTGVPDQIFGVVDDSFDDDDLPISEDAVPDLRLSPQPDRSLDRRFYKTQFKFLARVVGDGEHIRYADEETVPITPLGLKSVISLNKDGLDTVKLPNKSDTVFLRKKVTVDKKLTEEDVLTEIAETRKFSHQHIISVFGSYLHQGSISILSFPAAEYTLKSFLMDQPKSFEILPKSERRQILINWPHCLANAVAWLHANEGHHGAIRPSNIHITHNFHVSLGSLDGNGVLCCTTKSDDIEAYQYAPPERWKRAVTVQSTGSGKTALPSGGRTTRRTTSDRVHPNDPSARKRSGSSSGTHGSGVNASYTFMPTSKSNFARFRLSTTVEPGMQVAPPPHRSRSAALHEHSASASTSRSATRAAMERSMPARAPSVLSSTSSGVRQKKLLTNQGIFAAVPEARTAVVQTWQSVEHDSFAADMFSLGAVIMDILTVLCKKTYSSFARHRSAKNRNAGRGGGLADASFHANLGQVLLWAQTLSAEAEKKVKKDDSQILRAVGAVIQVTVQCLERSPDARLTSEVLERRLGDYIKKFANIDPLHCVAEKPEDTRTTLPVRDRYPEEYIFTASASNQGSDRAQSRTQVTPMPEDYTPRASMQLSPRLRPTTGSTATYVHPSSPPAVSLASFPSLTIDLDSVSETAASSSVNSRDIYRNKAYKEYHDSRNKYDLNIQPESRQRQPQWSYQHNNDSAVDPRLSVSESGDSGAFTYINYSTSTSDNDDDSEGYLTYAYPMPPTRAPTRGLPPIPSPGPNASNPKPSSRTNVPTPSQQPRTKPNPDRRKRAVVSPPPRSARAGPTRDDIAMLHQLAKSGTGGTATHPARMSSLQPGHGHGDGDGDGDDADIDDDEPDYRHQQSRFTSVGGAGGGGGMGRHSQQQQQQQYQSQSRVTSSAGTGGIVPTSAMYAAGGNGSGRLHERVYRPRPPG